MEEKNKPIKLNEVALSEKEFQERKKEIESMRNAELVEVAPNNYKIRFYD